MDISDYLKDYKDYIILGALVLGITTYFIGGVPTKLNLLGKYTKWIYIGIMVLAGYSYYIFHYGKGVMNTSFQRTTHSRNLADPRFKRSLENQRGNITPTRVNTPRQNMVEKTNPSKEVFDKFNDESGSKS